MDSDRKTQKPTTRTHDCGLRPEWANNEIHLVFAAYPLIKSYYDGMFSVRGSGLRRHPSTVFGFAFPTVRTTSHTIDKANPRGLVTRYGPRYAVIDKGICSPEPHVKAAPPLDQRRLLGPGSTLRKLQIEGTCQKGLDPKSITPRTLFSSNLICMYGINKSAKSIPCLVWIAVETFGAEP